MRWQIAVAAFPFMAASVVSGAHAAEIRGASRLDQVTVFPSGAEVTRIASVRIERGEQVVLFRDLPRAVPGSVRVEGKATGELSIASVDTRTALLLSTDEAISASERRRIVEAIEKLKDQRAQLQAQMDAGEAQKAFVASLAQSPTHQPPPGASAPVQPDWDKVFAFIGQRHAEAQKAILDTQVKAREVDREIKDLERKLASTAQKPEERTEVKVFVNAGADLNAEFTIRYQVASASWTPFYDARLATGTKAQAPKLSLERRASIQQRSGETWENVALTLSTTRPGNSTAAPDLGTQLIDFEPDALPPPPQAAAPPRPVPLAAGRVAAQKSRSEDEADAVRQQEMTIASEVRASVDAQGYQVLYGIAGRVTVLATGEAKRVQIDDMQAEPALVVRTVPKREAKAFLYAKAVLSKGSPLLPGAVSLFRDGTFVGTGRMPLLPPGEDYELGFGADDSVRVKYAIADEKRGETGLITSSKTDVRNFRIAIKNLHERQIAVTVLDNIPVSQNQDIKVELTGKTAPTRRDVDDKRGVMAWDMKLDADEEKAIEFGYRATWPGAKRIQYTN